MKEILLLAIDGGWLGGEKYDKQARGKENVERQSKHMRALVETSNDLVLRETIRTCIIDYTFWVALGKKLEWLENVIVDMEEKTVSEWESRAMKAFRFCLTKDGTDEAIKYIMSLTEK